MLTYTCLRVFFASARASVSTRNNVNPVDCDYQPFFLYELDVVLYSGDRECFKVLSAIDSLTIAKCPTSA